MKARLMFVLVFVLLGAMLLLVMRLPISAESPTQFTFSTATPSPVGFVASPTPTPLASDPVVADMLGAQEGSVAAMRILEYVYANPHSPHRARLLAHSFDIANVEFPLDWLAEAWLDENLMAPLNQTGRVDERALAEIKNFWRGDFVTSDWDGDGALDYFVSLRLARYEAVYPPPVCLYWIHRTGARYERTRLPTDFAWFHSRAAARILAARDVNGDGRAEIVYEVYECGRLCEFRLRVLEHQSDGWRELFSTPDWVSNERWTLSIFSDDTIEFVGAETGYPSAGAGTFFPYRAHFRLVNGLYLPTALSPYIPREQWDALDGAEQLAQKLMYARKFQDALYVLYAARDQYDAAARAAPPYLLFRIGFVKLLLDDVAGALQAWDELARKYPDHPTARSVQFVRGVILRENRIRTREDVWALCNELQSHHVVWSELYDRWRYGGNRSETRVEQWYADCDPTMLLPIWDFSQRQALEIQLARFGLQFETLSTQFDLNGDKITDPIGIVYFADTRAPWAFLSDGDVYHPLFAAQPYPFGAMDLTFGQAFDGALWYKKIQVTDLDANGKPEILLMRTQGFQLWAWGGRRFHKHDDYFGDMTNAQFREGVITVETTSDGKQILRVTLPATATEPAKDIQYKLVNSVLARTPPRIGDETPQLAAALNVLFAQRDARQALNALNQLEMKTAFTAYVRALAYEYAGERERARAEFRALLARFPNSDWVSLANAHLE